jgi:RimJ/RimL family protein N-acetyltransferase
MESRAEASEQPIVNIVGEKVALGPLRRELLPLSTKWFNDFEITSRNGLALRPTTLEATEEWYRRSIEDDRLVLFTLYERSTMRPIGGGDLHDIDRMNRTAELSLLIGEKDCWGKGYGTEATRLLLDYGFTCLGLHSIFLKVFSFNERALRAYTRSGFKTIGRRREAYRLGGRAYDEVYMDCLATEFESPILRRLLPSD